MAHYLPKKKYLQLLHDSTPPGSNTPSGSAEEVSSPDVRTTPSPACADEPRGSVCSPAPAAVVCSVPFVSGRDIVQQSASQCGVLTNAPLHASMARNADANAWLHRNDYNGARSVASDIANQGYRPEDLDSKSISRLLDPAEEEGDDCPENRSFESQRDEKTCCGSDDPPSCPDENNCRRDALTRPLLHTAGPLPGLASFSNLPPDIMLGLRTSSGAFSSLFGCASMPTGLADSSIDSRNLCAGAEWRGSIGTLRQNPQFFASTPQHDKTVKRKYGVKRRATLEEDGVDVRVKDESEDGGEYEGVKRTLVTTSGRNRGCGKALEPRHACQVCGDTAAGFHCGAYVCEACKKFYLRCLKSGGTPAFLCPKNNDCLIEKDTRSHCQFCRFQKCVELGMYKPGREDDKKLKIDFRAIPCKVCNAPSSGFHFGAITCEGCKGFFRRMLKEQLHKKFVCTNGEMCDIDSANRTTCKCCRFGKCLRIGMRLEGTRLGRQSNSVKRNTLIEHTSGLARPPPHALSLNHHAHRLSGTEGEVGSDADGSADSDDYSARYEPSRLDGAPEESRSSQYEGVGGRGEMFRTPQRRLQSPEGNQYDVRTDAAMRLANEGMPQANSRIISLSDERWNRTIGDGMNEGVNRDHNGAGGSQPRSLNALRVDVANLAAGMVANGVWGQALEARQYPDNILKFKREPDCPTREPLVYDIDRQPNGEWMAPDDASERETYCPYDMKPPLLRLPSSIPSEQDSRELLNPDALSPAIDNLRDGRLSGEPAASGSNRFASPQFSPALSVANSESGGGRSSLVSERRAFNGCRVAPRQDSSTSNDFSPNQIVARGIRVGTPALMRRAPSSVDLALSPVGDVASARRCRYQSGSSSTQEALERERLLYEDARGLFHFLTTSFKELNDILNRPQELDDLQHDPATLDTLWKLVEIPFMHQAKVVLKFVKKIPGFRQLPVADQIRMAQDSLYPITLIFHAQFYDKATGAYNWFINTPEERDLILSVLPPFAALENHFRSVGQALSSLALSDEELAFLTTMTAFTAADGSYLQAAKEVEDLQEDLLEAFVSHQTALGVAGNNRLATLLARLPELKRANIEHRMIATQVQQLAPQVEVCSLWQEVFLCNADGNRDNANR